MRKTWKLCSLFIVLLGCHLLVAASAFAQTLQVPERDVRDVQKLPDKADETLKTRRIQDAFPCEAIYAEMRKGFENLERLCSDPRGFSGQSLRLHDLRNRWVKKRCAESEMDSAPKKDAKYLLETGIRSVQERCVGSCFQKAEDLVGKGRCRAAAAQCRECCAFSPVGGVDGCTNRCDDVERQCRAAYPFEDLGKKVDELAGRMSEAVRILKEIQQGVCRNLL